MLIIQTLNAKNEVIATLDCPEPDPFNEITYVNACVEQAKGILYAEGFIGKNTRVIDKETNQLTWMSYYR